MYRVDRKRRLRRSVSLVTAMALVLSIAIPGQAKTGKVTEIQCSSPLSDRGKTVKTTLTIQKGKSFQIKTKYAGKKLVYKSSKKKVAIVSKKGKIKAKKIGKAKITISPKGNKKVKATITVTVVKKLKKVKKVKLNKTSLSLTQGQTGQLKATIVSPKKPTTKKLNWYSSDKKIASVNKKGVVTAKGVGTTTITVAAADGQGAKASCNVTVTSGTDVSKQPSSNPSISPVTSPSNDPSVPTPTDGTDVTPTPSGGTDVTPTPSGGANVTPTPSGGTDVTPTPSGGANVTPTPTGGTNVTPTPTGGTNVTPTPTGGTNVTPTPTGGANVTPTPTGGTNVTPTPTGGANVTPTPTGAVNVTPTPVPTPNLDVILLDAGDRTGIKQGEVVQLSAKNALGGVLSDVQWEVSGVEGVSISPEGLLTIAKSAEEGATVKVTVKKDSSSDSKEFIIIKNSIPEIAENEIVLNQSSDDKPLGLTYRTGSNGEKAFSIMNDPERGEIVKFDSTVGYTDGSGDVLAWIDIDPIYAGKEVNVFAYMRYDENPNIPPDMDFVIKEGFNHKTIASVYGAKAGEWCYIRGYFILPNYNKERWDGNNNRLYISLPQQLSTACATYYLDGLTFTVEKSTVDQVELSVKDDATEIFQNHELQCTAQVSGTGTPSQLVDWSIDPPVAGAEISDSGLLKVENAEAGAEITIKATSKEDPTKSDTKKVIVRAQEITSVTVSAKDDDPEFFPNNEFQFKAAVTSAGEPDESVIWSVTPSMDGVAITKGGLLTIGDVLAGTELTVTATSVFDTTKFGEYKITVLEEPEDNVVNNVTIEGASKSKTIAAGSKLPLEAKLETTGNPDKSITWSLTPIEGVSLEEAEIGNGRILKVEENVARKTSITVRATSVFDDSKYDEITLKVVDINDTSMEYWENFETFADADISDFEEGNTNIIWQREALDAIWEDNGFSYVPFEKSGLLEDNSHTIGMNAYFSNEEDYIQFSVKNESPSDQTYLLSFMVRFYQIAADINERNVVLDYELPLKLVSVDQKGNETPLKQIKCSAPCSNKGKGQLRQYSKEFHEIFGEVQVSAGETLQLRLKLYDSLPSCEKPDQHLPESASIGMPHPVVITLDNVLITSGEKTTINMTTKEGENTQKFNLDVDDGDTVTYYTNCDLAKSTHDKNKATDCPNFGDDTLVATVDENGTITALHAGETILVAEITHENGTVERKQCIVHVDN